MNHEQYVHPVTEIIDGHHVVHPGLTLTQWYAGQALQGILAANELDSPREIVDEVQRITALMLETFA